MADPFFTTETESESKAPEPVHAQKKLSFKVKGPEPPYSDRNAPKHNHQQPEPRETHAESNEHQFHRRPPPENQRMPSILDGVPSPKPMHINPLKPPGSYIHFNPVVPDKPKYAKPYD